MLEGVRWVLFDAVGTLIFADPPVAQVYAAAARRFGSSATPQQIESRFREALAAEMGPADDLTRSPTSEANELARWRRIVDAVFPDLPSPAADDLFDSLWQHFAQPAHWRLYPDAEPAITSLKERGLQLGLASNFDSRLLRIAAEWPALAPCEQIFVSSQVGYSKPDPRYFAAVAARLQIPPAEILLVGDDWLADIQGARAAGWQAMLLMRTPNAKSREPAISSLLELTRC
jgi:putative hydrolase of the HAD superfamily